MLPLEQPDRIQIAFDDHRLVVPRQALLPVWRQIVLPVHLLGLAPLLGSVGVVAGNVKLHDDGVVTTRSMATAAAMGLVKIRSHSKKTRFDVMPSDLRS